MLACTHSFLFLASTVAARACAGRTLYLTILSSHTSSDTIAYFKFLEVYDSFRSDGRTCRIIKRPRSRKIGGRERHQHPGQRAAHPITATFQQVAGRSRVSCPLAVPLGRAIGIGVGEALPRPSHHRPRRRHTSPLNAHYRKPNKLLGGPATSPFESPALSAKHSLLLTRLEALSGKRR